MNKRNTLYSALFFISIPTLCLGEAVTAFTIQDVGQGGVGAYSSTLDGIAGSFGFNEIYANLTSNNNNIRFDSCSTLDAGNTFSRAYYGPHIPADTNDTPRPFGFTCPGYLSVNTAVSNGNRLSGNGTAGPFTGGFMFAGQPFIAWTSGPITADISIVSNNPVLTIDSTLQAFPWGGLFGGGQDFLLHPTLTGSSDCTSVAHRPMTIHWVNRIGETDQYNYAIQWNHCITAAEDLVGNYVGFVAGWRIEGIMTVQDTIAPTVNVTVGATSSSNASIVVTFSEPMNPATVTTSSMLVYPTASGPGASECNTVIASNNNKSFTCAPAAPFSTSGTTPYTLRLTTAITDDGTNPAANALALTDKTFTMNGPDSIVPVFSTSSPANSTTSVDINAAISVTFFDINGMGSETSSAISLTEGGTTVGGFTSSDNLSYSLTPATPFKNNTVYTLFVDGTGTSHQPNVAQDPTGNVLGSDLTISFTTATALTRSHNGATVSMASGPASMVSVTYMTAAQAQAVSSVTLPDRITLDDNFIDYTINNVSTSVAVTLDFPMPITGKEIYKAANGSFVKLTEGTGNDQYTRVDADTITMTITDNGPNDNDATTGVIHDPIGTGVDVGSKILPGSLSGCSISGTPQNVWDHAEWLLLAIVLAWLGFMTRREEQN